MITSTFHVSDMHCSSCESRIADALTPLPGIGRVRANPMRRELFVEHDQQRMPALDLFTHIEALGFTPMLEASNYAVNFRQDMKRVGVAAIGMMQVVMQAIALYAGEAQDMASEHVRLLQLASFVFTLPVVLYSAQPFYRNAWQSIKAVKRPLHLVTNLSMDVPVALAISIAFLASVTTLLREQGEVYFDSVVMFTFLLLTARLIGKGLSEKRKTVSVLALLPDKCTVARDGIDSEVSVQDLVVGDRVVVRPGERVVADGVILTGSAHLDESLLTGEADIVVRAPGEQVTAGTVNSYQSFEFEARGLRENMRLARIERLAVAAQNSHSSQASRSSTIASYFVCGMLLVAALTAGYWWLVEPAKMLTATIAVLVVSCPCALALATPAAINAALSRLHSSGVVLASGDVLETAADITHVAFDKTGTLTTGRLEIKSIDVLGPWSSTQCLKMAAGLERMSNHPIARTFHGRDYSRIHDLRIDPLGLVGKSDDGEIRIGALSFCVPDRTEDENRDGKRAIWLSVNGSLAARFLLKEQLRSDVDSTISKFRQAGIDLMLLSGDSESNCQMFDSSLRIIAGLTPEQKREHILDISRSQGPVLMLGDGINDLPALATAELSASVLEAPDSVKSQSVVLLLSRKLGPVFDLLMTAKRTRSVIRQNTAWALLYNTTMIPLAASGVLAPWMAALGMSLSLLLVVTNSARLQRIVV